MKKKPDFNQLYQIAEAQAGYITARQAQQAGYSRKRLSDLTRRAQFARIPRGIYRLSHFPASRFKALFVAQLRAGPKSVISHESALAVYDLSDVLPADIHIIMPRAGSRRWKNLRLHTNNLVADEITWREGLRLTTPSRTILDVIASDLGSELVRQAVAESIRRGLKTKAHLLELADRRQVRVKKSCARSLRKMYPELYQRKFIQAGS